VDAASALGLKLETRADAAAAVREDAAKADFPKFQPLVPTGGRRGGPR